MAETTPPRAPPGAQQATCGEHTDAPAATTCERCGVFMCEDCTYFGVELRCVSCRIKRHPYEYRELIANAVKRAPMMHCRRCGYLGRRFEEFIPLPWWMALLMPFAFLAGLLPGLIVLSRVAARSCRCPACEATAELIPARDEDRASAEAEAAWFSAQRRTRRVYAVNGVKAGAAIVATVLLAWLWIWLGSR